MSALALLGIFAAFSAVMSDMPRSAACLLAVAALVGGGCSASREARRPPRQLAWLGDGSLVVDGERAHAASLQWRGPLAFLHWRDMSNRRLVLTWWPDTLGAGARRELRLAHARSVSTASRPSMAP